ncbi:TMEM175 family protein [Kaarinaea lacus]
MTTTKRRSPLDLKRLKIIIDVVYAVVIWRLFMILPRPKNMNEQWDSVTAMLLDQWPAFLVPALALLIVIIYWVQNNELFNYLDHTDVIHTGISLFQVFSLLLFLYAIGVGLNYENAADARAFESATAVLMGIFSYSGWRYAMNHGLLSDSVSQEKALQIRRQNFSEPATALITIPFAFIGPWLWELSWLLYPMIRKAFSGRRIPGGES